MAKQKVKIDYTNKILVSQVVLHNTRPGHNKCYEISVYSTKGSDKVEVIARWGKIAAFKSGSVEEQSKGLFNSLLAATKFSEALQSQKQSTSGYKPVDITKPMKTKKEDKKEDEEVKVPWYDKYENEDRVV